MRRAGRVLASQTWHRSSPLPRFNPDDEDDKVHGRRWLGKWRRYVLLILQRNGIDPKKLQGWKGVLLLSGACVFCTSLFRNGWSTHGKPAARQVTIRSLSTNFSVTASSNVSFYSKAPAFESNLVELGDDESSSSKNYGGLQLEFPRGVSQEPVARRVVGRSPVIRTSDGFPESSDAAWYYYAFDDDEKRNPLIVWEDDTIQDKKLCRRTSWHRDLPIDCNRLHEYDVSGSFLAGETRYLT